jgi:nicotinamidase-related amidase
MPALNDDLHGNVPDQADIALLLIDVINDLEFPEGPQMFEQAMAMARKIKRLKERARAENIPIVYVNDNFGIWQSDFRAVVQHVLEDDVCGRPLAEMLAPTDDDYFVLKPKHSAFYSTTLDILLDYLGVRSLILTGLAGNICVLFTANDAYMRDFRLYVPRDCCASNTEEENHYALDQMKKVLKADLTSSSRLDVAKLARGDFKTEHERTNRSA